MVHYPVTYPAVRGEVNSVDFVALEAMRVFMPSLYGIIRDNPDRFIDHGGDRKPQAERQAAETFHKNWLDNLPEKWKTDTRAMIGRLFPKNINMAYGSNSLGELRKNLRLCHPRHFSTYFRLSLPAGSVSRNEIAEFMRSISEPAVFKALLVEAVEVRQPNGSSRARALLERFMYGEEEIPSKDISTFVGALLDVGDLLLNPLDDEGMLNPGNVSRVFRLVRYLLKRLGPEQRKKILEEAVASGNAITCQLYLINRLDEETSEEGGNTQSALFDSDTVGIFKSAWVNKVRKISDQPEFSSCMELAAILSFWRDWSNNEEEVRKWCCNLIQSEEGLLKLIACFLKCGTSLPFGGSTVRRQPRLNPTWIEKYVDIEPCAERLYEIRENNNVPEWALEAVTQFLKEFEMIKAGVNLDDADAFDD